MFSNIRRTAFIIVCRALSFKFSCFLVFGAFAVTCRGWLRPAVYVVKMCYIDHLNEVLDLVERNTFSYFFKLRIEGNLYERNVRR